jgi:capsular exopolysaccharide synthesis family protein
VLFDHTQGKTCLERDSELSSRSVDRAIATDPVARPGVHELPSEEPLDAGRYGNALRRSWRLIALIVVPLTLIVLFVSFSLPKTYRASAKLVLDPTADPVAAGDAASIQRRLATIQVLLTSRDFLGRAARRLDGETADSLKDELKAGVDQSANIISVVATDGRAPRAARIANTVANSFLGEQRTRERERLARERTSLLQAIDRLRGTPGARAQIALLRNQLTQLSVRAASSRPELQLAEAAQAPSQPAAPHPIRNAIFALFASAFLAVLVVLVRAQLSPRVSGSRELSRLLDLPVLVEVPHARRGGLDRRPKTLSGAEYEAYQTLHAALKTQLPPTQQKIILVTSALHGEGKTEVTAGLGLALSQAGLRTWLVSADMRWPRLHELFDVAQEPGFAEVLVGASTFSDGAASGIDVADHTLRYSTDRGSGGLHVLASGHKPRDPAKLLASDALDRFFDQIKRSEYEYVLLDGPPLVGLVDSQVLAQRADGVLLVCRPDRLTPENAADLRDLLRRLQVRPLGLVVVGSRVAPSHYLQA